MIDMRWGGTLFVLGALAALSSCAHGRPKNLLAPPPVLPEPGRAEGSPLPPDWFWEPVDAEVRTAPKQIELPVAEESLLRVEGATRVWEDLGPAGRERLRHDGVVVVQSTTAHVQMGAFYMDLREQRVPYELTLDALAYALHVAFERALAEVDDTVLAPGLDALVLRLEARLAAEQKGAGVELGEALGLARAIVAVARGLSPPAPAPVGTTTTTPATTTTPPLSADLTAAVNQEIARILAHVGPGVSPVVGVPIDYARFAAPEGAAHPGSFRALTWLASAPLLFVAQSEAPAAVVGVARSRLHTRAAMLLARLSLRDVDPEIHALWSRIARVLAFAWGRSDDLSAYELSQVAASIGVALEDPKHAANVVTVDRLRRHAARHRPPLLFDGAGAPARAGTAMRLFGGHAAADSVALALLSGPSVGSTAADPPPAIARDGLRALPSSLDLAAWVGAEEGRAAAHESGVDAFSGYDAALAHAISTRPSPDARSRHASVHGSLLDVMMTWLAPAADAQHTLSSPASRRAAIESALAAWTFARHDGQPLTRPLAPRSVRAPKDLEVKGAPLAAFVEQAPAVIARLVATAGQMKRGLVVLGGLPPTSLAMTSLAEVEDVLRAALRMALREANDEPLAAEDVSFLASMPARLARLEEAGGEAPEAGMSGAGMSGAGTAAGAMVPVVAELVVDAAGERSLSTATGAVEPAVKIVREPGSGRLLLAVGAHVAHHDLVEPRSQRSSDASHRARLLREASENPRGLPSEAAPGAPAAGAAGAAGAVGASAPAGRGRYTSTFRMVR